MLQKPPQRLAHGAEFRKLSKHQGDRLLNAAIWIFLEMRRVGLEIPDRRRHEELAAARLRTPRFHRALPQEVQLVFVQAALQPEQQTIVAVPRAVHRVEIDQHGVHDAADFDELLPLATIPGEARHLAGRHRTDLAQTHVRHHASKPRACDESGGRPAQVVIHDLNVTPPELLQPVLHRILQSLALEVVLHLMRR